MYKKWWKEADNQGLLTVSQTNFRRVYKACDTIVIQGGRTPSQVPMPNSPLLLNCLCSRFLQEPSLTTELFILAFWIGRVLLPWQWGQLKTRLKNSFRLF